MRSQTYPANENILLEIDGILIINYKYILPIKTDKSKC